MSGIYLGQNFLKDKKYIDIILKKLQNIKEKKGIENILEIGPGKGIITKRLPVLFSNVFVFEKDKTNLEESLAEILPEEKIFWGDILEKDILEITETQKITPQKTVVFGNLPYYITSPILKKFFVETNVFETGIFMVQKQVGEKIQTGVKKKSYLRWILNYGYQVDYFKTVPAKAFSPKPKVDSCLISLSKNQQEKEIDFVKLLFFLEKVSVYKRKTLSKILSILSKKGETEFFEKFEIKEELLSKRLEELTRDEMKEIIG